MKTINLDFLKYIFLFGMILGFGGGSFCGIVLHNSLLGGIGFFVFITSFVGMCIGDSLMRR